jgi:hypothetical protein
VPRIGRTGGDEPGRGGNPEVSTTLTTTARKSSRTSIGGDQAAAYLYRG